MTTKKIFALAALAAAAQCAIASTSGLVISQVYGGGGNSGATYRNDYVELFNGGTGVANLAGLSLQYASATGTGNFSTNSPVTLSGSLQPGQYLLVSLASSGSAGAVLPTAELSGTFNMAAAAGKVALVNGTGGLECNGGSTACTPGQRAQIIDLVGFGGANFYEGSAAPAASATVAVIRAGHGCTDTDNNASDFSAGTPAPRNGSTPLAGCGSTGPVDQPIAVSCPPLALAAGQAGSVMLSATDPDGVVSSAQFVGIVPAGLTLGSFSAASGAGQAAQVALNAASTLAPGSYSVTVQFANATGQTATCSATVTTSGMTPIYDIQGSGSTSPKVGQQVTTRGVVTRVNNNGFFMQDPVGDGNPATSDGIFVFTSTAPTVTVGQLVQLSATVAEFNTGAASNADTAAHPVTELTSPSGISVVASGYAITPVEVTLPEMVDGDLERYEGMLVTLPGPFTVSQNYFLGRYGQLTVSVGGRMETPTNRFRPGPDADALADENARRRIVLDDGSSLQNPNPIPYIGEGGTIRAGDTTPSLTGVIDYGLATSDNTGFGDYRLHPTLAPVFARANPRTTQPDAVGGNLRVGSFNVLNYFTTIDTGSNACPPANNASDCRGADSTAEFTRQRAKIVEAIAGTGADVLGLTEIQNNGATAVQNLVDGLNARLGAGTYVAVPDPSTGTGTDAIKVAMIYKPASVTRVGASVSDPSAIHNRPPLAQTFAGANGERFTLVVNHFKSKSCSGAGGADADLGDGQGCWNARRVQQGSALRSFLTGLQSSAGTSDVIIVGDLNAYAQEDPIDAFRQAGYVDQIGRYNAFGYSYVFDGASGRLDHAIASPSMSPKVTGATEWHINADEPSVIDYNTEFKPQDLYAANAYRSSDHDPVIVGLELVKRIDGTSGRDTLVGTAGDDVITGGEGADTLTGNGGRNVFVYRSLRDAGDTITDFVPGKDRLDLSALLASIGYTGGNAYGDGVVRVVDFPGGASVQIDSDGSAGPAAARPLVLLRGVSAASVQAARDLGL